MTTHASSCEQSHTMLETRNPRDYGFYRRMREFSMGLAWIAPCMLYCDVQQEWQNAMRSLVENAMLSEENARDFLDSYNGLLLADELVHLRIERIDYELPVSAIEGLRAYINRWRIFK